MDDLASNFGGELGAELSENMVGFGAEIQMGSQELEELLRNNPTPSIKHELMHQPNAEQHYDQSMDMHGQMPLPHHLNNIPNLDPIQSAYDFDVCIPGDQSNNVVYCQSKLFIKMGSKMTVTTSFREQQRNEPLFLRAMLIFSKPAEMHLPVKRCANHRIQNEDPPMLASIIKINDPKAAYFGDETGQTFIKRLSVVLPLDHTNIDENGRATKSVCLEFLCQNSCSSGINRKPVSIVFTLENNNCELLGKSVIEFKVCSCPKRDAEREREPKPKQESNVPFPRGKRPKYSHPQPIKPEPDSESDTSNENSGTEMAQLAINGSSINIPTEVVPEFLKCGFNIIAGRMAEDKKRQNNMDVYEKCLKDLKKMRRHFQRND